MSTAKTDDWFSAWAQTIFNCLINISRKDDSRSKQKRIKSTFAALVILKWIHVHSYMLWNNLPVNSFITNTMNWTMPYVFCPTVTVNILNHGPGMCVHWCPHKTNNLRDYNISYRNCSRIQRDENLKNAKPNFVYCFFNSVHISQLIICKA